VSWVRKARQLSRRQNGFSSFIEKFTARSEIYVLHFASEYLSEERS